jgi:hypothetical protein
MAEICGFPVKLDAYASKGELISQFRFSPGDLGTIYIAMANGINMLIL